MTLDDMFGTTGGSVTTSKPTYITAEPYYVRRDPKTGDDIRLFNSLEHMITVSAEAVRPAERLTVSQSAEKYRYLNNPGSHVGLWSNKKTPYLVEPMDTLTSTDFKRMVFVGPARTGKSDMFFNWLLHTAVTDPADMMVVHMTQGVGRDWSLGDLQKNLFHEGNRNRPTALGEKLVPGRVNDNVFDKRFMSGMRLLIKHPTITELSGKTVPRVWINDADNMIQDVEGKGTPFDLGAKRTQTFKWHGMTVAEGSPAQPVMNTKFIPESLHEAPPAVGLMSYYNRGDRRRWYWGCVQCGHKFEPDFSRLVWPDSKDFMEASEAVTMPCPDCGFPHLPDMQYDLNLDGRWIRDGMQWLDTGEIVGTPFRSDIASYWLKGPAAAFTTWPELVLKYLRAHKEYEDNGDEAALFTTVTTDQGLPYTPKAIENGRLPDELKSRAFDWGGTKEDPVVPEGVRFLVACVDVQAGKKPSFVVHVFGIGEGGDIWHVDMFKIRYSPTRTVETPAGVASALIDPAAYHEDWDALKEQVLDRDYPLADGSGRRMMIKIVGCDSGGAAATGADAVSGSVTESAYQFYLKLRSTNDHKRLHLLKGAPSKSDPLPLRPTMWNTVAKGNFAIPAGGIQGWLVNSNSVKDTVSNKLGRLDPGGQIYFPIWAEDWLYQQLTAEVRTEKGWERQNKQRKNEAFDLLAYCVALGHHPDIRLQYIDWSNPPGWAKPWDQNELIYQPNANGERPFAEPAARKRRSLKELATELG